MRSVTLLAAVAILAVAGCARLPIGAGYEQQDAVFGEVLPATAESLAPGGARDADVLAALGPPTAITALPDGYAFLYEGGRLRTRSVGGNFYQFQSGYAWSSAQLAIAAFVFDDEGILCGAAVERGDEGTGSGFSAGSQGAQAFDQIAFLLPASQHFWGRQLLRRLPAGLNRGSDMASGLHGLERRGTPVDVGQRTLASGYSDAQALLDLLRTQTGQ
jgi:hypothetical protein